MTILAALAVSLLPALSHPSAARAGDQPAPPPTAAAPAAAAASSADKPTPTLAEQCKGLTEQTDKLRTQLLQTMGAAQMACSYSGGGN